jgi:transcriptional regulator with XRE-family HTH domain
VQLCGEELGVAGTRSVSSDDRKIAERIRSARAAAGFTQAELAQVLGVSVQQMTKYEQANNRISAGQLVAIARALAVSVASLVGEDAAMSPVPRVRTTTNLVRYFCALDADLQYVVMKVVRTLHSSQTLKSPRPRRNRAQRSHRDDEPAQRVPARPHSTP